MVLKITVIGACGRMGQEVIRVIKEKGLLLSGAVDMQNAGKTAETAGVPVTPELESVIGQTDVTINFSAPSSLPEHLRISKKHGKPAVIGITGLSREEEGLLKEAAGSIGVVYSPNMSVGVNLLFKLAQTASRVLAREFDMEVIEAHHRMKKDAPSGTAVKLADILAKESGRDGKKDVIYGREGMVGERKPGEIGVLAVRGGDIVGEHTVLFAGNGERVELVHRATSRSIFAQGAVRAAEWVVSRKSGLYSMADVLGL